MAGGTRFMVARISTVAFQGIDVLEIDVQVRMASCAPSAMSLPRGA
jgi:hypothetical protein